MFIHFGLYSILGGEWKGRFVGSHDWIRNNAHIPRDEYAALVRQFDPTGFDADAWVQAAKDAGQRYLVLTTKHHDGFALFDSAVSAFDVMATPYHRDIVRAVAEACRRHGIRVGFYYSIMDWNHPDYLPHRDWEPQDPGGADFTRYVTWMRAQLRELLTHYGPVDILWFDGQWEKTWTRALGDELYAYCRRLAPDVIINDRIGGGPPLAPGADAATWHPGDFTTPEQQVPAQGLPGVDWESCMTMNHNWGYAKDDHDFKSVPQLVRLLVDTASKGGNLLLNVGPMGDGRFPPESVDGLRGLGAWMRVNGEAIYGSRATPFPDAAYRVTAQPRRLNVFVDEWRAGVFELPGLRSAPRSARILGGRDEGAVTTTLTLTGLTVVLPERPPDEIYPVVALTFASEPRVEGEGRAARRG